MSGTNSSSTTTGSLADMAARLRAVLPQGWFPGTEESSTPVLSGLLAGFAWPWAQLCSLLDYTQTQTRLHTSTGNFIDMVAQDYFGSTLPRLTNEADTPYIARIRANLTTGKNTRTAMETAVSVLTSTGTIYEPWRAPDCNCYGRDGYGVSTGRYGSRGAAGSVFFEASPGASSSDLAEALLGAKSEGTSALFYIQSDSVMQASPSHG